MPNNKPFIQEVHQTIDIEIQALHLLKENIRSSIEGAIGLMLACKGRVIITGIGKSAIIAQKIVATLNSTGTSSYFMHAADAVHGDLGLVQKNDLVVVISQSGETPEIKVLIPVIKKLGNPMIAITGNQNSFLAKNAHITLNTYVDQEACPHNLAPTSSTTSQIVLGDVLAVMLLKQKGFTSDDFAKYHPGGNLGKRLYLRAQDICDASLKAMVNSQSNIREVILEITSKRLGIVAVIDGARILGVITDGDIRRMLQKEPSWDSLKAIDIMSKTPKSVQKDDLVYACVDLFKEHKVSQLLVLDQNQFYGFIHFHDVLREGLL